MKTFCIAILYIAMVAALDLGGAVWTSFHGTRSASTGAPSAIRAKTLGAVGNPAANPSDT